MLRCEEFQLTVKSEREDTEEGEARAWLVSVQVCLSGTPLELREAVQDCQLTSDRSDLTITCLGLANCSTMVYSVQEVEARDSLEDLRVGVVVTPLYHPSVTSMYRLDSRLAELVGRKVLAHPKYALTIIHGYARANKLYYQKTIKCDELLYNIFERENIELGTLWKEICRKIKKVERGVVSVSHKMSTLEKCSSSEMRVSVDNDYNIYPENWKLEISRGSKSFLKTQSFLSNVTNSKDKRKSFKRNKSFEL